MARFHGIDGKAVPFTEAEEAEQNAIDKAWNDGADARAMSGIRAERNAKLAASDWTQSRDITLSNDTDWKAYRTALRDLPANVDLNNITWPKEPE